MWKQAVLAFCFFSLLIACSDESGHPQEINQEDAAVQDDKTPELPVSGFPTDPSKFDNYQFNEVFGHSVNTIQPNNNIANHNGRLPSFNHSSNGKGESGTEKDNQNNKDDLGINEPENYDDINTDTGKNDNTENEKNNDNIDIPEVTFEYETVSFPGGEFTDRDGNQVIVKPFSMMKSMTSVAQMWECISHGQCSSKSIMDQSARCHSFYSLGDINSPSPQINCVTYEGATEFCKWLGGHVPTENEWEYAALFDGEKVRDVDYPWGNDSPELCKHAAFKESEMPERICFCANPKNVILEEIASFSYTSSYTSYEDSAVPCDPESLPDGDTPTGLHNMAGSLAEYVQEIYLEYDTAGGQVSILKGGSYLSLPEKLKIREREYIQYFNFYSNYEYDFAAVGFRCAFDE